MKFDIQLPGTHQMTGVQTWSHGSLAPDDLRSILQAIDSLGFHAVTVSEHLGMPQHEIPRLGAYWLEPLTTMAFIAAHTKNVRIDSSVLVLPYHHPLRLAKSFATIDVLSSGRLNISIGVGHAEDEFEALGIPFKERGALTDEILAALVALWSDPTAEHVGTHFQIRGLGVEPRPVQSSRPPIHVGGNSKPALRRAARHEGWQPNPIAFTIDQMPPLLDYLHEQPGFADKADTFDINWIRPPSGARLANGFGNASAAELAEFRDRLLEAYCVIYPAHGVTRVAVATPQGVGSLAEFMDFLAWFGEEVIEGAKRHG